MQDGTFEGGKVPEGPSAGSPPATPQPALDWHRWVSPEVRLEIVRFLRRSFAAGIVFGLLAAGFYWRFSESKERIFQGAIIFAACAFTMPAFAGSLKIMLSMFYMTWGGQDRFDKAAGKAESTMTSVDSLVHRANSVLDGKGDERESLKRVVREVVSEAVLELGRNPDGPLSRIQAALEALTAPIGQPRRKGPGLLESGIPKDDVPDPPMCGAPDGAEGTRGSLVTGFLGAGALDALDGPDAGSGDLVDTRSTTRILGRQSNGALPKA